MLAAERAAAANTLAAYRRDLEGAEEVPMCFKTTAGRLDALMDAIARMHPYEVPEIVAVPVSASARPYRDWVREQTAPRDESAQG